MRKPKHLRSSACQHVFLQDNAQLLGEGAAAHEIHFQSCRRCTRRGSYSKRPLSASSSKMLTQVKAAALGGAAAAGRHPDGVASGAQRQPSSRSVSPLPGGRRPICVPGLGPGTRSHDPPRHEYHSFLTLKSFIP